MYLKWVKICWIDTWVILVGHLLGQQVGEFTVHNFVLKKKFKVVLNHKPQWGSNIQMCPDFEQSNVGRIWNDQVFDKLGAILDFTIWKLDVLVSFLNGWDFLDAILDYHSKTKCFNMGFKRFRAVNWPFKNRFENDSSF